MKILNTPDYNMATILEKRVFSKRMSTVDSKHKSAGSKKSSSSSGQRRSERSITGTKKP